ncbi:hypothetical protein ADILRU_0606 [Leifsonia rubra CMS 76R]|nr:hypothetical protein ADILRU_0606 [Leifsonia rubra CMS 76R]
MQEIQTLYVLEALLSRLAVSPNRDDFVLKGSALLAAFAVRRPTRDIDLQATGLANDADEVAERIRQIAITQLADGVVVDPTSIRSAAIRDDNEYTGIRIKIIGILGTARLTIGVDVNFGDPIWPTPQLTGLPRIVDIGQAPIQLLAYPLTMILAEKLVTAIERGDANTRWRDFADIYTLMRVSSVDAHSLVASLATVADYRQAELRPLLPFLERMPRIAQPKWRAWRSRVHREDELPADFAAVVNAIGAFVDPILARARTQGTWRPGSQTWEEIDITDD